MDYKNGFTTLKMDDILFVSMLMYRKIGHRENDMIRKAEEKDIKALMDIYNDAILTTTATFDTEEKNYENRKSWFEEHKGRYVILVYEDAGQIKGYASLSRYRDRKAFDPTVEISIYIHKHYRGQHIGKQLMEAVLKFAREKEEIDTVISLITSENEASIRLHEAFGFAYCGQIRNAGVKFGRKLNLNAYEICYS
ncbi:MAG: GNAT family N-acetyltransferase [Roseburia sp.]